MKIKNLLLIPSDIAKITSDGTLAGALDISRITQASIMGEISMSVPIVTDDIINVNTHLSTTYEQKQLYSKSVMSSNTKNIIVEVDLEGLLTDCITGAEMLNYIKENNKMPYIASVKSLMTNGVIDIYYHTEDKCLYVSPELSAAGNPPIAISGMNISMHRVAPLKLEASINSSTAFAENTDYYQMKFKDTVVDLNDGLAVAKTDVTAYTMLVQGLNIYSVSSEYSRNTNTGGTVNQLGKDRPIHLVVLEELAEDLLDNNNMHSGLIIQSSPHDWKLRITSKNIVNKIAFPIHI